MNGCPACRYTPPADISPTSERYHREHRDAHLAAFPMLDVMTVESLDYMVRLAERGAILAGPR
jgi:hypothetical protein